MLENHIKKILCVVLITLFILIGFAIKGCNDDIETIKKTGLKNILTEIWEGKQDEKDTEKK